MPNGVNYIVDVAIEDVFYRPGIPTSTKLRWHMIFVQGRGDHLERPPVVPALTNQTHDTDLSRILYECFAHNLEAVGRMIEHLVVLSLVGERNGRPL